MGGGGGLHLDILVDIEGLTSNACARTHAHTHARTHARTHAHTHSHTHTHTHARAHTHLQKGGGGGGGGSARSTVMDEARFIAVPGEAQTRIDPSADSGGHRRGRASAFCLDRVTIVNLNARHVSNLLPVLTVGGLRRSSLRSLQ